MFFGDISPEKIDLNGLKSDFDQNSYRRHTNIQLLSSQKKYRYGIRGETAPSMNFNYYCSDVSISPKIDLNSLKPDFDQSSYRKHTNIQILTSYNILFSSLINEGAVSLRFFPQLFSNF